MGECRVRVVAGRWGGRRIAAPDGRDTRPTSDRVREGIFSTVYSIIGSLEGHTVLDLYAGSGALGIEALSRGAAHVVFVESGSSALRAIAANLEALGADHASFSVVRSRVEALSSAALGGRRASLLLADPPYRIDAAEFSQVLEGLGGGGALEDNTLAVYEHAALSQAMWPSGFREVRSRRYGDTAVSFALYEP